MKISTTLIGKETLERNFKAWDLAVKARAREIIAKHSMDIANDAKTFCPVDMGQLRSSIRPTFYQNGLVAEISTNTGYAAFIEFGTGPLGKQQNLFGGPLPAGYQHGNGGRPAPIGLIMEWMKRKGIRPRSSSPSAFRALAFVIARSIGRRGLAARPFLWPAFEKARPKFERDMQTILSGSRP